MATAYKFVKDSKNDESLSEQNPEQVEEELLFGTGVIEVASNRKPKDLTRIYTFKESYKERGKTFYEVNTFESPSKEYLAIVSVSPKRRMKVEGKSLVGRLEKIPKEEKEGLLDIANLNDAFPSDGLGDHFDEEDEFGGEDNFEDIHSFY